MDFTGDENEFTGEEYAEKEALMNAAPRHLLSAIRNAVGDYDLVDGGASGLANTSFEMAAINQILAWLNFPYQQRPYLDCLIGLAGSCERDEFSATNIEIARQVRTGKNANDDSMAKWVTRQKKKFQLWQSVRQFNLVEITDGKFDAKRRKNTPTTYKINLVYWAKQAVQKAKSKTYWRNGKEYRRNQIRAIRQSCYEVLQSLPEAPPLRLKIRTLSEEEKLDRRVHLQISSHEKNLDFIHKMGMAEEELHQYVIRELNKAFEKKRGLAGNLVTTPEDEPQKSASVFYKLKTGTLLDDDDYIDETENFSQTPIARHWEGGGWVEPSNKIPEKDAETEISRTDIVTDNVQIGAKDGCNSLKTKIHGRTFLDRTALSEIIQSWFNRIAEKLPDNFNFYRGEICSETGREAEALLQKTLERITNGASDVQTLKPVFIDYSMERIEYRQNNIPMQMFSSQILEIRRILQEFIKLPEDLEYG